MKQNPRVLIPNKALRRVPAFQDERRASSVGRALSSCIAHGAILQCQRGRTQAAAQGGGWGRQRALAILFPCATDGWAEKSGRGGPASPILLSRHCSHLRDTRSSSINVMCFSRERGDWGKGWLAFCPCPRMIVTER